MDRHECYEKLAEAIILFAVRDYRKALRCLQYDPDNQICAEEKRNLEQYFRSDLFNDMTGINGEMLIKKMKAEVKK